MQLLEVHSVSETEEEGTLLLVIDFEVEGETLLSVPFVSRATDVHGLGPVVLEWLNEHPDFPRQPHQLPDLDELKALKLAELTAACGAAIVGGFVSSALGVEHTYPSQMTDQINLMGSVTDSILPDLPSDWSTPFWCADAEGNWEFRMHDAVQIRKAGRDGKTHVVICQAQLEQLTAQVYAANSGEEVSSIVWSTGEAE